MVRMSTGKIPRTVIILAAVISITAASLLLMARYNAADASTSLSAVTANAAIPSATFPGTNTGAIPDGLSGTPPQFGAPRTINFAVTGITGPITNVDVNFTATHTWVGDVEMVLAAPGGSPSLHLASRIGVTTAGSFGDSSNFGGTYAFDDSAAGTNIWTVATAGACGDTCAVTAGTYRTVGPGQTGQTNPAPVTSLNTTFGSLTPAQANGTWTLTFRDAASADVGSVTAANLIIDATPATPSDANVDVNGDGKTDWVVARGTLTPFNDAASAPLRPGQPGYAMLDEKPTRTAIPQTSAVPQAPPIYWYTMLNGPGTTSVIQLGDAATDFITPEDFDGDGKDDFAVWTEAAGGSANFKIFRTSDSTLQVQIFGQTGDDPAIVGDYDGDGKADPAVFRCPPIASPDGQCFYFFRGSLNNPSGNITYFPWGFGVDGDFFPYVGDLDGDGKHDFCLQRANPTSPTNGQFVLRRSMDGGVEYINWGLSSDFLIPGDYDGDGKTDICVRRTVSGARHHWILYRTGGTAFQVWGVTGDVSVPGDYDGDGKTDLAIWRGNTDPTMNFFWVSNSNGGTVTVQEWGQCGTVSTCDFPVAGWAVH